MTRSPFFDPARPDLSRRSLLGVSAAAFGLPLLGRGALAQGVATAGLPRRGGMLRLCRPDPPDTLHPHLTNSFSAMEVTQMIYDNLAILDANDQPQPQLATSWRSEKAGAEWVVELRDGVKFHDGAPFTADDVVSTIERTMDKATAGLALNVFGPVSKVVAEGPLRVRVSMSAPFGEFPVMMGYRACRIMPKSGLDSIATAPNGTGPFRFKEYQPGSSLTVERNPDYWDAANIHLDGVRVVYIREAVAMQAALRGGQVDLLTQIPVETYLVMRAARGFRAVSAVTGDYHTLNTMGNMKPFDDPRVRDAFRYMIDRKSLITSALFGQGAVGDDVTPPPGSFYLPPDMEQYAQDLPRAKKLLEEAKVGPLELDLYASSERQPAPKMALAVAEAAGQIGVKINVRDIPYVEYAANVARKKPLYNTYFSGSASLYDGIYRIYQSKQIYNYSGFESGPGTDAILDQMISEPDVTKRQQLAFEAVRRINKYGDRLIPYFRNYLAAHSEKVQGFVPPKYGTIETRWMWLSA